MSGGPIISLNNYKIIGIHKGGDNQKKYNIGTFIREPIKEFNKKFCIVKDNQNPESANKNNCNKILNDNNIDDSKINLNNNQSNNDNNKINGDNNKINDDNNKINKDNNKINIDNKIKKIFEKENEVDNKGIIYDEKNIIKNQIFKGICNIKSENKKFGMGFFCNIPIDTNDYGLLITYNDLFDKNDITQ